MPRKPDPDRMLHPGRTSAEHRALDRIGCGEPPACSPKTPRNLLEAGLIVDAAAFTDEEMAAFEAELEAQG